jgi:hypothetical protein
MAPPCKEDPNYVSQKVKLRGLDPNFHSHVSVSDLYIVGLVHLFFFSKVQ